MIGRQQNVPVCSGLVFFFSFITLLILCTPIASVAEVSGLEKKTGPGNSLTVLIYHRFGEERYPTTNVSVDGFQEQLAYLRDNNYQVLELAQLYQYLSEKKELPEKAAVITIDDGYKSVYQHAWPLLQSFGYPFTIFIYVKATDNKHWDYMTWDQVRELQAQGVDFQNHGYGHHRFGTRPKEMNEQEYNEWIAADFAKSTKIMEQELGVKPRFLALPYGEYNRTVINLAKKAGFEAVFSQDPGSVGKDIDLYSIPREPILGDDWSSIEHFDMILNRTDLPLNTMVPGIERLQTQTPQEFSARLLYPDRYRPGTVGIYVSELGWRQATGDGDTIRITNDKPLQRRLNRVAVSGREKGTGRTAIRFWLLVNEFSSEVPKD
jgi:peptidoglycan/xylan/chitin deacetylase (PgdA/CDA1 family)